MCLIGKQLTFSFCEKGVFVSPLRRGIKGEDFSSRIYNQGL